jgi:hypothetical protein
MAYISLFPLLYNLALRNVICVFVRHFRKNGTDPHFCKLVFLCLVIFFLCVLFNDAANCYDCIASVTGECLWSKSAVILREGGRGSAPVTTGPPQNLYGE